MDGHFTQWVAVRCEIAKKTLKDTCTEEATMPRVMAFNHETSSQPV
jgi:hypothetical protein